MTMITYSVTTSPLLRDSAKLRRLFAIITICLVHLSFFYMFLRNSQDLQSTVQATRPLQVMMLKRATNGTVDRDINPASSINIRHIRPIPQIRKNAPNPEPQKATASASVEQPTTDKPKAIEHNIAAITKLLERELAQDERKAEAAKPPNQLVREYWEKQNHPYQDKWQELSAKIEKAAVARGPQEESYTLDDGSRITKINGACYKAPDPGRAYLGQAEVRRVFCPRN